MARFLFWNLNKKLLSDQVSTLCRDHSVDVLILAESTTPKQELLKTLNKGEASKFSWVLDPHPKPYLSFYIRYPSNYLTILKNHNRFVICKFTPPIGVEILLVAVHLPSKLHQEPSDQVYNSINVSELIQKAEEEFGHTRTAVVGDFNMDPFENGIIQANGFHTVMDQGIAKQGSRIVQKKNFPFFYNPMWGRMGDRSKGPPGSYYYDHSGHGRNLFWHTFDQVLIRPALLAYFPDDELQILSSAGELNLLHERGHPDTCKTSDHLPLLFTLTIEREVKNAT